MNNKELTNEEWIWTCLKIRNMTSMFIVILLRTNDDHPADYHQHVAHIQTSPTGEKERAMSQKPWESPVFHSKVIGIY